ncbi:HD domain-containing protein [Actinoplanes sp. NPDC049681]|uniref:HD domain-containing protein n=1 Tax=Actinoplanes sp. NPDC049681 TaxID=3363905 RepID=UPI0037929C9D
MTSTVGKLLRTASDAGLHHDIRTIWQAYEVAEQAHRGQRRISGDRYISHPVEVATIVAGHGGTAPAVCAALLHDVMDDDAAAVPASHLRRLFGCEVAGMVEDMAAQHIRSEYGVSRGVMLVTLADRLHNLRTLRRLPAASRRRASLDTLEFHVPMAHQLKASAIAAEMSDLACAALGSLDGRSRKEPLFRRGPRHRDRPGPRDA